MLPIFGSSIECIRKCLITVPRTPKVLPFEYNERIHRNTSSTANSQYSYVSLSWPRKLFQFAFPLKFESSYVFKIVVSYLCILNKMIIWIVVNDTWLSSLRYCSDLSVIQPLWKTVFLFFLSHDRSDEQIKSVSFAKEIRKYIVASLSHSLKCSERAL